LPFQASRRPARSSGQGTCSIGCGEDRDPGACHSTRPSPRLTATTSAPTNSARFASPGTIWIRLGACGSTKLRSVLPVRGSSAETVTDFCRTGAVSAAT
jgi:hypothetical protein